MSAESVTVITPLKKAESTLPTTNAALPEDDFKDRYWDGPDSKGTILVPPYDFNQLEKITEENNALGPCVSAYEVNIDGSGYIIEKDGVQLEREKADDKGKQLFEFFDEICPGQSLVTFRREMRKTLEITGNAFIEVVRNTMEEIVFLNLLPTNMMRMVKLGEPISAPKTIKRFGKALTVNMMVRERAFVQKIGVDFIYFKEFDASRDIDKKTGEWKSDKLGINDRGNEVIHLVVDKAANSPYGVPRWISQAPSVMGSRKAEELNLEFFDSGGVPPVIVFVSGGMLTPQVRQQLENVFNSAAKDTTRGAVVEVQPSGGTIDKDNRPTIMVEKFGAASQNDSMFETYDEKCEKRIRRAFRLPPLFVGMAQDYNYASAYASYLVAEAQVFSPEREEFDERFNATIMKALMPEGGYTFKSKQISITDVETQLKGLELLKDVPGTDAVSWVGAVNEVTGVDIAFDEGKAEEENAFRRDLLTRPFENNAQADGYEDDDDQAGVVAKAYRNSMAALVDDFAVATGVVKGKMDTEKRGLTMVRVSTLSKEERKVFDSLFAMRLFPGAHHDMAGAKEVCSCLIDHGEIGDAH